MERSVSLFTVIYRPGPRWVEGRRFQEQDGISAHRDFLGEQFASGKLVAAGPFLDDSGGVAIFECGSSDELDGLLRRDQTIAEGLMEYETHPCVLPFMRTDGARQV